MDRVEKVCLGRTFSKIMLKEFDGQQLTPEEQYFKESIQLRRLAKLQQNCIKELERAITGQASKNKQKEREIKNRKELADSLGKKIDAYKNRIAELEDEVKVWQSKSDKYRQDLSTLKQRIPRSIQRAVAETIKNL